MAVDDPTPPFEAQLIRRKLTQTGMSMRALSRAADLSDSRLRQILNGYETRGEVKLPVRDVPALTIARIINSLPVALTGPELDGLYDHRPDVRGPLETLQAAPSPTPDDLASLLLEARSLLDRAMDLIQPATGRYEHADTSRPARVKAPTSSAGPVFTSGDDHRELPTVASAAPSGGESVRKVVRSVAEGDSDGTIQRGGTRLPADQGTRQGRRPGSARA